MNRKNPTSPLRCGFDYQDLWTLKLCGNWLLNPDKYKWIQIDVNPTEERDFFLDDIVLLDQQGRFHYYQAKFKTGNQYQWSWDDFLKKRKGKERELPSLFNKWSTSLEAVDNKNTQKAALMISDN